MKKRVFLFVLDSMGIGEMPDASKWGDEGSNTLASIRNDPNFNCPNLINLGLFNIDSVGGGIGSPIGSYARMTERSNGKDTTTGHWEISGIVSDKPMPTYPSGFPDSIISEFENQTGRKVICNKPYSGTDVIRDYGEDHLRTGALIVYTSADSVFQIAAHESIVPPNELYGYCETARKILCGDNAVGRVIARPFSGEYPFVRTHNRRDFSIEPPSNTMLDIIKDAGMSCISVGKIYDIFAGRGITEYYKTSDNDQGMEIVSDIVDRDFEGLCFLNLVDFDMLYGHRNDISGYAAAMAEFDKKLGLFLNKMHYDDILIITADHGCDPSTPSTDHSREYTPMIIYGERIKPAINLGTRDSFADIGATILKYLGINSPDIAGNSFLKSVSNSYKKVSDRELLAMAASARKMAYAPYSNFKVGAALLCDDGTVYLGCNVENASYPASICAERVAISKAISEGKRIFDAIAIVGGKNDSFDNVCAPCGICRQVMSEFCSDNMRIILGNDDDISVYSLSELLPLAFDSIML